MDLTRHKNNIINIIDNNKLITNILQSICIYLKNEIPYYDWVGFYFKNGDKEELKLACFSGKPTEHVIIPFGKGICGQVAVSNKNFMVQDVTEHDNYISCGIEVKSEIVIPIFVNGDNIGQIDIDSHSKKPFTEKDMELLEFICKQVSNLDVLKIVNKQL